MTDLLPVFLQAGLAGEVAGVMHGLQLPEDPATGKNVHPAPILSLSISLFLTNKLPTPFTEL